MKNKKLTIFIFVALFAGIIVGALFPKIGAKSHILAAVFLNMIKMIIAPLLFSTLVVGIAGHGDVKNLGKIGLKTIIYFEVVTTIALVIGLVVGHVVQPGKGFNAVISQSQLELANQMAHTNVHQSFGEMLVGIIPTSIIESLATGNLLQIVFFAIFFALAMCTIGQKAKPVMNFLTSVADIMFKVTEFVMYFAPFGIFGAIASTVAQNGMGILGSYAKIVFALYFALALFVICVLVIACKICRVPFMGLIKVITEPAILAFTTASSEAALPKAMTIMEKFGVSKNIVGFVMPTGYTFNLDGSTLYLALGVLFSTQIVGIDLTVQQQILLMLALMLTSKGVAGVPRVSLVVMAGTLASFGYPIVGVAILLGIDQILDMGRTTVNLIGNCVATVVIARWENDFDYAVMNDFINSDMDVSAAPKALLRTDCDNAFAIRPNPPVNKF